MKKVLICLLVLATVTFADKPGSNGDVPFLPVLNSKIIATKTAETDGFAVGTKASSEVIRDLWVGSDFDQNGNKEVLLASYGDGSGRAYVYEITDDNTATLFFDTGDLPGGYTTSTRHVGFGDLDGNGMQELIVSVNAAGADGGLYVYEYDTVGDSMRAPVHILSDLAVADRWYVEGFYVDDVDGDGVQEIMFGNNASSSSLDNFYIASVESGTFADDNIVTKIEFTHGKSSTTYTLGGSPYGAVTSDMDGDGHKEVLFAGWDHGAMLIVEADAADTYTVHNYIQTDLTRSDDFAMYDFTVADVDGDGRDEAYVNMYNGGAIYCITCPSGTDLSAMTTANVHALGTGGGTGCAQIGDLDGNGKMDIYASTGGSTITDYEYQGGDPTVATNWVAQTGLTSSLFSGVYGMRYAGDLDGDGLPEIYGANTGAVTDAAVAIEVTPAPPAIFISELADPKNDYTGRFMELFNNTADDIDLSGWTVNYYSNANTSPSVINLSGTIYADSAFVIANSATSFETMFGFAPDMASSTYNSNGDDNMELVDPYGTIVDVFGVPGEDGTGTDHDFADGKAVRKASVTEGNSTYDASEWTIIMNLDAPDGFDPGIWPTVIPLEFADAYPSSGTTITIDYTDDVTSVDPANYSLLGTSGVTFTAADIDAADASIVTLTASAEIMYDLVLDTLIDAANTDTAVFYAGITPIGWTNTNNPDGHIEDGFVALFNGYVSANDGYNNVWVNDAEGGEYTGAMIYSYDFDSEVAVGDEISFLAERDSYNNLTELVNPVLLEVFSSGNNPYGPFEIPGSDIDTALTADTDPGEIWEGQLVRIDSAVVLSYNAADYEYLCTDDDSTTYFLVGDNVDYHLSNVALVVGSMYDIVGVVDYNGGYYRINPRGADDAVKYLEPGDLDINEDFTTDTDITNWRSDNSGYTVREHVDGAMQLSDGGWTFDARRTVIAEPNTFFKATATIKTGSFNTSTSQYLYFGVDGLGDEPYQVSCISEDEFTTFTIIGYAVDDTGSLYIAGQGASGADTAWVDAYTFQNNYVPELGGISDVLAARAIADGEMAATIGVVTTTTNYGSSGPAYIQDESAGIAVYDYDVAQNVALGDEILVVGEIDIYNGLVEIKNADYTVLSTGNVVEPVEITAADMDGEAYEGMLVVMKGCDTTAAGIDWPAEGSNKGFDLVDKNDSTFYCYIDKDTDIDGSPKPDKWPINITGIVGDYNGAQLLPRSLADFVANNEPGDFTILNPVDGDTIKSLDDPAFVDTVLVPGGPTVKTFFTNWTTSVDPDEGDLVTYEVIFLSGNGPDEESVTTDTSFCFMIDEQKPWKMNGTYEVYVRATDLFGAVTNSDTVSFTFEFEAPPEIKYADIVLVDGAPKLYATFNQEFSSVDIANFMIVDMIDGSAAAPTAVDSLDPVTIMLTGDLIEDHYIGLAYSGIVAPGKTLTTADTAWAGEVLIPFSKNHPEDAIHMITDFESNVGSFLDPNFSGSTTADDASTFEVSDEQAFQGSKSGKMTIVDNTSSTGGWYVRELYGYPFAYTVKTSSKLMFALKGTDADVQIRLSVKDTGYEQSPWVDVSLSEDDWQIVSFDLMNDQAEGWITGNGIIEGETVLIEGIHIRCPEDKDVVLYIDGFTERQTDLPSVDVTMEVGMAVQALLGNFTIGSDFVDVAGNFNDWGNVPMVMDDSDGDSVYSYTITGLIPGQRLEYKFRINGSWDDNTAEFPYGGPPRIYTVPDTNSVVFHWYKDEDRSVLGIEDLSALPKVFALHQNYPNPFNPITTIKYDLPKESNVKIVIYDVMGHEVRTLVNTMQRAGYQSVQWNAKDNSGKLVSSGYYIYLMQAGDFHKTQKMILLK